MTQILEKSWGTQWDESVKSAAPLLCVHPLGMQDRLSPYQWVCLLAWLHRIKPGEVGHFLKNRRQCHICGFPILALRDAQEWGEFREASFIHKSCLLSQICDGHWEECFNAGRAVARWWASQCPAAGPERPISAAIAAVRMVPHA